LTDQFAGRTCAHIAVCSTHEQNFGTVFTDTKYGNFIDAEAAFAKDGWTGDTRNGDVMCPACSKRIYVIKG